MATKHSNTADAVAPELFWVRNDAGRPRVRWSRVVGFLLLFAAMQLVGMGVVAWYAQTPIRWTTLILLQSAMVAYLIVAIELQYRHAVTAKCRFHLGLKTWFVLTLLACVFFATASYELQAIQRNQVANNKLKAQLQQVVDGGSVSIGRTDGTSISINATRADFSDRDLARVIELATARTGRCELSMLVIEKTAVTPAGIAQLAACRQLTFLALPPLSLDEAGLAAICGNARLEFLMLDETKLTADQLSRLREALPRVRLNGRTWQGRGP